ncbi:MAG: hypothetical protein H7244_12310 [Herminiimonas sp.]|nr:hypothetical protein [Herminiimonas sp.]
MPIETIGKYEIDFEAEALPADAGWAAYAAVFGASDNPAHRKSIIARKRVALETAFTTEEAALAAAREHAIAMLD